MCAPPLDCHFDNLLIIYATRSSRPSQTPLAGGCSSYCAGPDDGGASSISCPAYDVAHFAVLHKRTGGCGKVGKTVTYRLKLSVLEDALLGFA
jgi:hypothetical protein